MRRTKSETARVAPQLSPVELEERVREAQSVTGQIQDLVASTNTAKRSMAEKCAESVRAPHEKNVNRLIWYGIVQYANASLESPEGIAEAFLAFQAFTTLCLIRQDSPFESLLITELEFRDLQSQASRKELATFDGFLSACCGRLRLLHRQFRGMLSWLADPNALTASQRSEAISFLREHGGEGAIEFHLDVNNDFDDSGNRGSPFYYWKIPTEYRSILSPVSSFVLHCIEQYQTDNNQDRLALREAIPVMACKRAACGRFAVLQRTTKEFCSASCRTLHRQETKPEAHAAYQRKYREVYKKPG
jgi:hypothetical protein